MKFFICKKNNIGIENVVKKVQSELEKMGFEYTDSKPDIVISIGGDGTFLEAIQNFYSINPLFANINYGNLGYLCEYKSEELEFFIKDLLDLNRNEKNITLLECKFNNYELFAFNEFRIESSRGDTIIFDVFINDTYLETLKGDGCCVSTSIGSSGMARSIGGAIVDNEIEMIQFVEKAPIHNRSYSSMKSAFVLEKSKVITIKNIRNSEFNVFYDNKGVKVGNFHGGINIFLGNKKVRILKNLRNNYIKKTHEAFIND